MSALRPTRSGRTRASLRNTLGTGRAFLIAVVLSAFVLAMIVGLQRFGSKQESSLALLAFLSAAVVCAVTPRFGVYLVVFFTLLGDTEVMPWYPMAKNMSSRESLLYLSDQLVISPLEVLVAILTASWIVGLLGAKRLQVERSPQFWAIVAFTAFVVFGFAHGIATGGDVRVALFEGRHLFLVLPLYLVVSNLFDRHQLRWLVWTAAAAITLNAVLALRYYLSLSDAVVAALEDLGEHNASVHFAFVLTLTLSLFLYRGSSRAVRWTLLLACVPIFVTFLNAQRRAAVVGLVVGVMLVLASTWWRARAKFFVLGPIIVIVVGLYTAAFWNSTSSAGFPAQAIKTVVAPDSVTQKDASSDLYRDIENFDLHFTIRAEPVTGLGFGQKFYRPARLPDISFFEFYEYIPHNSVLYLWIKLGFFGFLSLMAMIGIAISNGATSIIRARDRTDLVMAMAGVCYVTMFIVFAFVDIAWLPRTLVLFPIAMRLCALPQPEPPSRETSGRRSTTISRTSAGQRAVSVA